MRSSNNSNTVSINCGLEVLTGMLSQGSTTDISGEEDQDHSVSD